MKIDDLRYDAIQRGSAGCKQRASVACTVLGGMERYLVQREGKAYRQASKSPSTINKWRVLTLHASSHTWFAQGSVLKNAWGTLWPQAQHVEERQKLQASEYDCRIGSQPRLHQIGALRIAYAISHPLVKRIQWVNGAATHGMPL